VRASYMTVDSVEVYEIVSGIDPCPEFIKTFVVRDLVNGVSIIIDPGPASSASKVLEALEKLGIRKEVRAVFATHIHIDHYGAGPRICRELKVPLYVHPRAVKHVIDPSKLWRASIEVLGDEALALGKPEALNADLVRDFSDGQEHSFGGLRLVSLHTPGHAPHHAVYIVNDLLTFTGDACGGYDAELDIVFPTSPRGLKLDIYVQSLEKVLRESVSRGVKFVCYTHLSTARNPREKIVRHARQLAAWIDFVRNRGSLPSLEEVASVDEELRRYLAKRGVCARIEKSFLSSLEAVYSECQRIFAEGRGEELKRTLERVMGVGRGHE